MAIKLSAAASRVLAGRANVATQMGGGTTQAEVQGIADILDVMAKRPDLAQPILLLCTHGKNNVTPG